MSRPIPKTESRPHAVYLGDAVYANIEHGGIWLTTEDGINIINEIFLEPEVLFALNRFALKHNIIKTT